MELKAHSKEGEAKSLETISEWLKKRHKEENASLRHSTPQELVARSNARMKVVRRRTVNTVYDNSGGLYCIPVSQ